MTLLYLTDILLYTYSAICTGYLLLFSTASRLPGKADTGKAVPHRLHRFLILIPAYKEDNVIADTVTAALKQDYPPEAFHVLVISDQMTTDTNSRLQEAGAEVLPLQVIESSKAIALQTAVHFLTKQGMTYDYVVILDADNLISPDFLFEVNQVITRQGCLALQTHRTAKNQNTDTAMLDAAIEEMNNSIFRAGHVRLGFSSALIGSGMVFHYPWFARNITHCSSAGEDKELEELLLRQHIHIGYADHIYVWDEKVQQPENLRNQRRRWIATQFFLATRMWKYVFKAICTGNGDYLVKTIQSSILPRSILLGLVTFLSLCSLFISSVSSIKWWILLILLMTAMYMALPSNVKGRKLFPAVRRIPHFVCIMVINLFRMKGAAKKFIHTRHG